jgi:hypothetical protein
LTANHIGQLANADEMVRFFAQRRHQHRLKPTPGRRNPLKRVGVTARSISIRSFRRR